ncbi:hypothetical protein DL766_009875 [Monosporascus sp. MC13-8B]|uniref:GH16 domain-containing protein n=1 Tax=Monosporascus cannonballus TaxID=155416 RepID=A0ABY0GR58_9PEZI|nr:hypothetical protein DL762_010221 [Monosporascus cannonballus]RYP13252.1 hypothetical protein DL766_009875 [Monosporascus sp. MC13-8B]
MLAYTFFLLALSPLTAHGLSKRERCSTRLVTITHTVTLAPSTVVVVPSETSAAPSSLTETTQIPTVDSTTLYSMVSSQISFEISSQASSSPLSEPSEGAPSEITATVPTSTEESTQAESSTGAVYRSSTAPLSPTGDATVVADGPAATNLCGNSDRKIMPGYPWIVSNAMYNADLMVGQQCTNYESVLEAADGTQQVRYTSVTDIQRLADTEDDCKGYSNIGICKNLGKRFRDVTSIPAYFQWERKSSGEFKGANVFDFVTAPSAGDTGSTATSEFMLWIKIWGGQVPIGYSQGPVATFDLYGTTFKLYEGKNPGNGVTVRSALPESPFGGVFEGDLRDWLGVMAARGYIRDADYVNVGNAGTEIFYGNSEMKAVVALEINV